MISTRAIATAITAFGLTTLAFGASVPSHASLNGVNPPLCGDNPSWSVGSASEIDKLVNNATALFAWQLATISADIDAPCTSKFPTVTSCQVQDILDNFDAYVPKWEAVGLNTEILHAIFAARNGCGLEQDKVNILEQIFSHIKGIEVTLILNMWTDVKAASTVLCNHLDSQRLIQQMGDDSLISTVCSIAGLPPPPTASTGSSNAITDSVFNEVRKTAAQLFAWEWLGSVTNTGFVKTACGVDGNQLAAAIDKLGLDSNAFVDIFCQSTWWSFQAPADQIRKNITTLSTHILVTVLMSLSNGPGYLPFICAPGSLSTAGMQAVGMDPQQATSEIAEICKASISVLDLQWPENIQSAVGLGNINHDLDRISGRLAEWLEDDVYQTDLVLDKMT